MESLERHEDVADEIRVKFEALWESLKEADGLGMTVEWSSKKKGGESGGRQRLGWIDLLGFAGADDYGIEITRRVEF